MAEAFGIVSGAVSMTALFKQTVECFQYIQLGRHFAEDFERSRLKLDLAVGRLVRWGEAVSIQENPRIIHETKGDAVAEQVQDVLEQIFLLMQSTQKVSKRYETKAKSGQGDVARLRDEDLKPVARSLHSRLTSTIRRRQKQTSFIQKTAWALYDYKNYEKLISEFKEYMDELEKLCPAEEVQRRELVNAEIEEVTDQASLLALKDAAADIDPLVFEAVSGKVSDIRVRNVANEIRAEMNGRVRFGNDMSDAFLQSGALLSDSTVNQGGNVFSTGSSAIHFGNTYGTSTSSFWSTSDQQK